jgi:beta-glucosidase
LHEPFNIKDLAVHLRCHPDFLSRKFKKCVGTKLSSYVRQVRIERAKKMLENPKLSIDYIAEHTGFSDRVNFGKVFHRLVGLPPGHYKSKFALEGQRTGKKELAQASPR